MLNASPRAHLDGARQLHLLAHRPLRLRRVVRGRVGAAVVHHRDLLALHVQPARLAHHGGPQLAVGLPHAGDVIGLHQVETQHELVHVVVLVLLVHDEDCRVRHAATVHALSRAYYCSLYTRTAAASSRQAFWSVRLKPGCCA